MYPSRYRLSWDHYCCLSYLTTFIAILVARRSHPRGYASVSLRIKACHQLVCRSHKTSTSFPTTINILFELLDRWIGLSIRKGFSLIRDPSKRTDDMIHAATRQDTRGGTRPIEVKFVFGMPAPVVFGAQGIFRLLFSIYLKSIALFLERTGRRQTWRLFRSDTVEPASPKLPDVCSYSVQSGKEYADLSFRRISLLHRSSRSSGYHAVKPRVVMRRICPKRLSSIQTRSRPESPLSKMANWLNSTSKRRSTSERSGTFFWGGYEGSCLAYRQLS